MFQHSLSSLRHGHDGFCFYFASTTRGSFCAPSRIVLPFHALASIWSGLTFLADFLRSFYFILAWEFPHVHLFCPFSVRGGSVRILRCRQIQCSFSRPADVPIILFHRHCSSLLQAVKPCLEGPPPGVGSTIAFEVRGRLWLESPARIPRQGSRMVRRVGRWPTLRRPLSPMTGRPEAR